MKLANKKQVERPTQIIEPLLIGASVFARLLGISMAKFYRLKSAGQLPASIPMAGVKWRRSEVVKWIEAGCTPVMST